MRTFEDSIEFIHIWQRHLNLHVSQEMYRNAINWVGWNVTTHATALFLAEHATLFGLTTTDLVLDAVEGGDARQRLGGDRCGARSVELVELAAHVASRSRLHVALPGQHLVASVAVVHLQ